MVDDGCITEASYLAGTFDSCFGELIFLVNCTFDSSVDIVETLQVGFTTNKVTVDEGAGMVTLTIQLNQNAWITEPVTVTYSTAEDVGAQYPASKLHVHWYAGYIYCLVFCSKQR